MFSAIPMLTIGDDEQKTVATYGVRTFASSGLLHLRSDGPCERHREIVRRESVGRSQTSDGRGHIYERFINRHGFEIVCMGHQDGIKLKGK